MKRDLLRSVPFLFPFVLVFVLSGFFAWAEAQTFVQKTREKITAEGEGEAEIQGQDLNRARQEAMEDAMKNAFERALFEVMPEGLSLTEHQDLLQDLTPTRNKYLLKFRILAEMPALQVFFMTVEATFSNTLIQEELGKRGMIPQDVSGKEPVAFELSLQGISSFGMYQDLLQRLPEEIEGIESLKPMEVYGTLLVVRFTYRGDLPEIEDRIRQWILHEQHARSDGFKVPEEIEIILSPVLVDPVEPGTISEDPSTSPENEESAPQPPEGETPATT